jgi:hypothetical protein
MKKQLVIIGILALLVSVGLSGCTSTIDNVIDNSKGTCYYDFKLNESYYAGYYFVPPEGYKYIITTLCVRNEAEQYVSTNPYHWNLNANGISYEHSVATYDEGIGHKTVKIYKGGIFNTTIIFEIPENVNIDSCRIVPNDSSFSRIVNFVRDDSLL